MNSELRELFARISLWLRVPLRFVGRLGFGRHAALAAARRVFPPSAVTPARRSLSLLTASALIGIGVTLLNQANLGLSPHDVLVSGLQPRLGLSFGQTVWVLSAAFFLVAAILGQRPNRWGIAFVFANGVAIDSVGGIINSPESLLGRGAFVAAAVVAISAAISLVVHSGCTGGSFELLMTAGEIRGYNRATVRTSLEVGVLSAGTLLGGTVGVATLVIAVAIGPLLGLMSQAMIDHSTGRTLRLIDASPERRHPSAARP